MNARRKPKRNSRQARRNKSHQELFPAIRLRWMIIFSLVLFAGLIGRVAWIQLLQPDRLIEQGDLRTLRTLSTQVERGIITDRHGDELAVSVPVQAVWLDPKEVLEHNGLDDLRPWRALAELLEVDLPELVEKIRAKPKRRFLYVRRQVTPATANFVRRLSIPGLYLKKESRRFYPAGEVSAHVVGFTNIDDQGQEGVERSYDSWLSGRAGKSRVRKDRSGRVVEALGVIEQEQPPQNLTLSLDQRVQSVAYQAVKRGVQGYQAKAGSVVVIDVTTGEVLAMANSPSYNPNRRDQLLSHLLRNRAITDTFEPGSTVKPLVVAGAMESGRYKASDIVNTSPGWMRIGGSLVRDPRNYGPMDLRGVLRKSSNIGVSKLALDMPVEEFLGTYYRFGFGIDTGIGLIGEQGGVMRQKRRWSDFELATLSFGYGLTVTPLQLAQAYAILGSGGIKRPLTLLPRDEIPPGERVLSESVARQVVDMLVSVTEEGGTAPKARVPGYRIAGKTGTARKAVAGGYGDDYVAVFAGVAPASEPRLAVVALVDEPAGDLYYGGDVAAPIFAEVMQGALQLLNVAPDNRALTR